MRSMAATPRLGAVDSEDRICTTYRIYFRLFFEKHPGSRTRWYKLLDAPVLSLDVTVCGESSCEREIFIDDPLVRVYLLVDRSCATGFRIPFSR